MSTGVKEAVKTGWERPNALSIFLPMLSSPGGPGVVVLLGVPIPVVVPRPSSLWPGPWDRSLFGPRRWLAGEKLRGGCWEPSLSAEDGWNLQRIPNDEASCRQRASRDELSS